MSMIQMTETEAGRFFNSSNSCSPIGAQAHSVNQQDSLSLHFLSCRSIFRIARPHPFARILHQTPPHRILVDVIHRLAIFPHRPQRPIKKARLP